MTVAVVTDSAASLPAALVERWGVRVVPQHLVLGGQDHPDGALRLEEVLSRASEGISTSAPSPGEFLAILEEVAGDGAVVITVASEMSGTYKSAWLAATTLDGRVRVVDSRTAAGAEGLVVLAAARAASEGASLDEVEELANALAGQVQLIATVPGLEHLVRSGRVPGLAGWAGRLLGLQPLFAFSHGRARPLRPSCRRTTPARSRSRTTKGSAPTSTALWPAKRGSSLLSLLLCSQPLAGRPASPSSSR